MKKIIASLIFTAMLVSLAACGSRTDKDSELTKESAVMESGGVSPVTEKDGAESGETGSANTETFRGMTSRFLPERATLYCIREIPL